IVLVSANLNSMWLRQRRLGKLNGENSVGVVRFDLGLIESLRQLKRPHEGAIRALDHVIATFLISFLPLAALLTTNCQHAILGGKLDVIRIDSRKLDLETELFFSLTDVDRRGPGAHGVASSEGVLKEPVDLPAKTEHRGRKACSVQHFFSSVG